jgi:hypothetical protein
MGMAGTFKQPCTPRCGSPELWRWQGANVDLKHSEWSGVCRSSAVVGRPQAGELELDFNPENSTLHMRVYAHSSFFPCLVQQPDRIENGRNSWELLAIFIGGAPLALARTGVRLHGVGIQFAVGML